MAEESFSSDLMTRRGVERVFQLSPEPPAMAALNDYILAAKNTGNNNFYSYFLHHYEKQLNSRNRSSCRLGYRAHKHLCEDGDSVRDEMQRRESAERDFAGI